MNTKREMRDTAIKDMLKISSILIHVLWAFLSFIPLINMAYGETKVWVSGLFVLTSVFAFIGVYLFTLAAVRGSVRAEIHEKWKSRTPYFAIYAALWIMAFSFFG